MKRLFPNFSSVLIDKFRCDACDCGKNHRNSFNHISFPSTAPFHLIHSDVWGLCRVASISSCFWFVTFIYCFSRTTLVYLMKEKNEVFPLFQRFYNMVSTQFSTPIKILRTDNGREFIDSTFEQYLADRGIIHQTSCAYSPAQNGVAERKNRHLLEVARCLLHMQLPKYYWGDDVLTAAYLINRMPTRVLDFKTPLTTLGVPPITL
ncbi:hypothetical protein KSP39_PZI018064 [Platanthera zijinensis]|uniref:Integrase catalytic domain-containing protein n=1 Tax=Platanthera zijinensis TaxID=2320716 RepID=A0AAP0FYQ3_9ASPA